MGTEEKKTSPFNFIAIKESSMNFSKRFLTQIQPKVAVSFLWQREDLQKWVKGSSVPQPRGDLKSFNVAVELDSEISVPLR